MKIKPPAEGLRLTSLVFSAGSFSNNFKLMLDSDGLAACQLIEGAGVFDVADVRLDLVEFFVHPLHIG